MIVGVYTTDVNGLITAAIGHSQNRTIKADTGVEFIGRICIRIIYIQYKGIAVLDADVTRCTIRSKSLIIGTYKTCGCAVLICVGVGAVTIICQST